MIFMLLFHKHYKTNGAKILQEHYFLWSLQAYQIWLKSETGGPKSGLLCNDLVWNDSSTEMSTQEEPICILENILITTL
jgi:hypothetical protein